MDLPGQRMTSYFVPTLIPTSDPPYHLLAQATAQQLTSEPHISAHQAPPPSQLKPTANLYLCNTANNATTVPAGSEEDSCEKTFVEQVEKSYKELTSHKIKDTLSSFLPKVPGEVDSTDTHPETMLQDLIEHRPIGGKEFHPLSNQALLGFRLKPGPLPEQFKMDPALLESKPHHRKRKRKHKTIDKSEEGADPAMAVANTQVEMPDDACNFIKTDHPVPANRPGAVTIMPGNSSTTVIARNPVYPQAVGPTPDIAAPPIPLNVDQRIIYEKEKRKKKKDRRDKKERKEKKEKKRKKHHSQEGHGPTPSQATPLPPSLPPHTYTQYPTQYNMQ